MAKPKKIRNDSDLFVALSSDKELQDELRAMLMEDLGLGRKRNTNANKTLQLYAQRLKNMIEKHLRASGVNFNHPLFDEAEPVYNEKRKCVEIKFSSDAFRPNVSNKYKSFVPVLLNYGWENENFVATGSMVAAGNMRPTFMYYAGSYFITDAIQEFNEKYKDKKIYANFLLGNMNLTLYTGEGKLPYRTKRL